MWLHVYSDLFVNIVVFTFSYSLSFLFFSFLFCTLCKHKANTTELHLKVRPTCITFCIIPRLTGKHPHSLSKVSRYCFVVQFVRGSSFWHFLSSWFNPRKSLVTIISFRALRLYCPSPMNLIVSAIAV